MDTRMERMRVMHSMCEREYDQLRGNLSKYLTESEEVQNDINKRLLGEAGGDNSETMLILLAFDNYMTQLSGVLNLTRKLNIHLQLNDIKKCTNWALKSLTEVQPSEMFTDYVCNSILREQNLLNYGNKTTLSSAQSSGLDLIRDDYLKLELKVADSYRDFSTVIDKFSYNIGKDSPRFSFVIRPDLMKFKKNSEFNAVITFIQSETERIFFITEMSNEFMKLSQLTHIDLNQVQDQPPSDEILGVMFKSFTSEFVYRVVVTDSGIWLIDFGEIVKPDFNRTFYYLPEEIRNIPAQAIKCILDGVNEQNGSDKFHELGDILVRYEFKKTNFRVVDNMDNILRLILLDKSIVSFKELNNCLNIEANNNEMDLNIIQDENKNITDGLEKSANTFLEEVALCENTKETIVPEKLKQQRSTGQVDMVKLMKENEISIRVTHVMSPISFYGHFDSKELTTIPICLRDDDIGINDRYIEAPLLNEIVYAQYYKNGYWYRAKIIEELKEKELFRVFYVDHGNTESVPLCCLAKYRGSIEGTSYCATLFRLAGLSDLTEDDNLLRQQAVDSLSKLIKDRKIVVQIIDVTEEELVIKIVDRKLSTMSDVLIHMNYAKPK